MHLKPPLFNCHVVLALYLCLRPPLCWATEPLSTEANVDSTWYFCPATTKHYVQHLFGFQAWIFRKRWNSENANHRENGSYFCANCLHLQSAQLREYFSERKTSSQLLIRTVSDRYSLIFRFVVLSVNVTETMKRPKEEVGRKPEIWCCFIYISVVLCKFIPNFIILNLKNDISTVMEIWSIFLIGSYTFHNSFTSIYKY